MSSNSEGRHRMDRSLDEIAAEMSSGSNSGHVPFGENYERRDYIGEPIRGSFTSTKRHIPYSVDRSNKRDRGGEKSGCRIFVANLSFATTHQSFREHMRKAGPVVKCDIFKDSSGNSRGMGLVVYEDEESAEVALRKLPNTELDSRKLYLRKDLPHEEREKAGVSSYHGRGKPLPNPAATVFIGNLDYGITWQKLKDVFKVAGRIVNADILTDREGKSKGLGEVQFEDPSEAVSAIALFHGQMLCDRPMTVRMDSRAPFQPDPLQLKLSSLGVMPGVMPGITNNMPTAAPPVTIPEASSLNMSKSFNHHRGGGMEYGGGFDQRGMVGNGGAAMSIISQPNMRDLGHATADIFSRRPSSSRHDYNDSRRGNYSSSLSFGRGMSDHSSSMLDLNRSSSSMFSRDRKDRDDFFGGRGGSGEGGNRKLFVKNLNYSTSWQHLKDVFRGAGSVQHVDIMEGPDGRSKGCAVIYFDSPDAARKAIDMFNDYEIDGRRLEVRYDRLG